MFGVSKLFVSRKFEPGTLKCKTSHLTPSPLTTKNPVCACACACVCVSAGEENKRKKKYKEERLSMLKKKNPEVYEKSFVSFFISQTASADSPT